MEDKYTSTNQKIGDFATGFFLNILIIIVFIQFYSVIGVFLVDFIPNNSFSNIISNIIGIILIILIFITEFFIIKYYFKTKRYVAIGILSSLLLPLLLTGFCTIIFF